MPIDARDNVLHLIGPCPIEEAEALHQTLRGIERPIFDLSEAGTLHTAIVQLIMASGGAVRGLRPDPILAACLRDRVAAA